MGSQRMFAERSQIVTVEQDAAFMRVVVAEMGDMGSNRGDWRLRSKQWIARGVERCYADS